MEAAILVILVLIGLGGIGVKFSKILIDPTKGEIGILEAIGLVFNDLVLLFLSLALLFFVWNVVQYFIFKSGSTEGREKARKYALWSIVGFVFIVSIWGIVNLLVSGAGFGRTKEICPDFIGKYCTDRFGDSDPPGGYVIHRLPPSDGEHPGLGPIIGGGSPVPPDVIGPPDLGKYPDSPPLPPSLDAGARARAELAAIDRLVRDKAFTYVRGEATVDFGENIPIVQTLFEGLDDATGLPPIEPTLHESVLTAVERLELLGAITAENADAYGVAIANLRGIRGNTYIFRENIHISEPLTRKALDRIADTRRLVENAIFKSLRGIKIDETINGVAVKLNPLYSTLNDERIVAMALTESLYSGITVERGKKFDFLLYREILLEKYLTVPGSKINLWDRYYDDINMERLFAGEAPL